MPKKKQNEERDAVQRIGLAMALLPPEKREYMLGYADGVIASRIEEIEAQAVKNSQ